MNKKTGIIIAIIIAAFSVFVGVSMKQGGSTPRKVDYGQFKLSNIENLTAKIDYDQFDLDHIIPASNETGNLPENINGNPDAPVLIYEYADYPCSYCANMNPLLNKIVEEYDGEVAVVFRSYIISYHERNGVPAASAANAAAVQGYWKKYKDLLFANQDEWFYSTGDQLEEQLVKYFETASAGKGDLEKFQSDMKSENIAKKVAFDRGIGEKLEIGGTPWLYMDGEWISNKNENGESFTPAEFEEHIRTLIDQKLQQQKQG